MLASLSRALALPWLGGVLEWGIVLPFAMYMLLQCASHFPEIPSHEVTRHGQRQSLPDSIVFVPMFGCVISLLIYVLAYVHPMGRAGFMWAPHRKRHLLYQFTRWSLQLALLRLHVFEIAMLSTWLEPLFGLLFLFFTQALPVLQREMRSLDHSYKDTIA